MEKLIQLSIVIITMNRQALLCKALESCMDSHLPENTEFIIIDNASTDKTEEMVNNFFTKSKFDYTYKKLSKNIGVGGGRNTGFDISRGKYIYFLDDDAIIIEESKNDFFIATVSYLDNNANVATLTTKISDQLLKYDRKVAFARNKTVKDCPLIFMYLGGSHFLRREYFESPLYLDVVYGYEELAPSLYAFDKGYYNIYYDRVGILHCPPIDKWQAGTVQLQYANVSAITVGYATKFLLYPYMFRPILFLFFLARYFIHLHKSKGSYQQCQNIFDKLIANSKVKKIKTKTVISAFRDFGFCVF